ncbi:MAG: baseplate J/gp47 family protein [Candidatus Methanoperedens sp.]|nr:baseplate J/gp47 family protein [Candidatus Methanoperedens sp.]
MNEKHEYTASRTKYRLAHARVLEIVRIDGTVKSSSLIFRKEIDYRQSGNMVEWLHDGEKPDENTPFFVNYRLDAPMIITDINPGSVIRTIIESVALEIDYLYAQMNQIYNAGFIDTATGKSLDLVVSLLGITRKKAGFATGEVTFGRNGEPGEIEVSREAHVYDGKDRYMLKNPMAKIIKKVDGNAGKDQTIFVPGQDYIFSDNAVIWAESGRHPDIGSVFYIDYAANELISIPVDMRVSTYSRRPENLKIFRTTRKEILTKNSEGRWEVEVPVVAMSPGKQGNVFAGSLNVMPKPIMGIEYVINKKDIMNGTDDESDPELRERAKSALEKAGKATLISLKSAVQSVEGVTGEVKVEDQPDGVPGIVQIVASGGDDREIERVIEETRSAGIKVEFKRPIIVPLDIKLSIAVVEGIDRDEVRKEVDRMIRQYLGAMNIDDDVIHSQIIKSALGVQGVKDVHDVTINGKKENLVTNPDEKGEFRTLEIFLED